MSAYVNRAFADQSPAGADTYRLSTHGPDFALAPNFTLLEFACRCGPHPECDGVAVGGVRYHDVVRVHPSLVVALQGARYFYGAPVRVHSGYRPDWYNADVEGAAEGSTHTWGGGADVSVAGVTPDEVASFFRDAFGAGGVGLYDTHVHVSVGREGGGDRRFGREWRAVYDPTSIDWMLPQLAPVAAALGVDLSGGGADPYAPNVPELLASAFGGWGGVAALGLFLPVAYSSLRKR